MRKACLVKRDAKCEAKFMASHIKKGDMVEIIAGAHRGATGKVLRIYPGKNKVVIQGHNLVKKHVRPSRKNPQGGRVNVEQPIHVSNVLPVNPKTSQGSKVRCQISEDGSKKMIATDGTEIRVIRRAREK